MRRLAISLGFALSLGAALLAAPVEITTEEDLAQLLDQVCRLFAVEQTPSGTLEQTPSYTLCLQLRERLQAELQERLREYGSLVVDPEILAASMALGLRWVEGYAAEWGFDEAAELVAGLTELAKQYGQELRDFLAQANAAGYSPEEIIRFVTGLAQQVTEDSPAKEALEEVLDSVEDLLEEVSEKSGEPHEEMEEDHGKGEGDGDHGAAYEENEKPENGEKGNGTDAAYEKGGKGKGNGEDEDNADDEDHNGKSGGSDDEDEDHGGPGHKGVHDD